MSKVIWATREELDHMNLYPPFKQFLDKEKEWINNDKSDNIIIDNKTKDGGKGSGWFSYNGHTSKEIKTEELIKQLGNLDNIKEIKINYKEKESARSAIAYFVNVGGRQDQKIIVKENGNYIYTVINMGNNKYKFIGRRKIK